jgi:moderate conductance mechanosensitive channel
VCAASLGVVIWLIADPADDLDELGVPLQPILAGAGLAGIVIGFGAQQLVRDVLAGIAMLIEDQYGVGDWIEVDGRIGQVERVGLRSTAFRDVDGVVHHVLNGYIQRVGNLSQEWARATSTSRSRSTPTSHGEGLIHKVATELADDPVWGRTSSGRRRSGGCRSSAPTGSGSGGDPDQAAAQLGHDPPAARAAQPRLRRRRHPDARPARRPRRATHRLPC